MEGSPPTDDYSLCSVPLDASQPAVVLDQSLVVNGEVKSSTQLRGLSPDGRLVVWRADELVDERYELFVRAIDGAGSPVVINDPLAGDVSYAAVRFGPGSTRLVYSADQDVKDVVELDSTPLP